MFALKSAGGLRPGAEPPDVITRFERIRTSVVDSVATGSRLIAERIARAINRARGEGRRCRVVLAGGASTSAVYRELLELQSAGSVDLRAADYYSLFEFYPIRPEDPQSHSRRLLEDFLLPAGIDRQSVHLLSGTVESPHVSDYCRSYEHALREGEGTDIVLVGIDEHGRIAGNEPGTHENTRTRVVVLSNATRAAFASEFAGIDNVPKRALSIGIDTILNAREVLVAAWGEEKSAVLARAVEGEADDSNPAGYLQRHSAAELFVDRDAAAILTREATPWIVGSCDWTPRLVRRAVLWLCRRVGKPILKLTYQDYADNALAQMLDETGMRYDKVNIQVFNDLQHTISGWPGGKPNADDTTRPARSLPYPKRVLIFSPHPDDDVISMGGTFLRLVDQGHDVHVAYQTSGNIAVHDDVVLQIIDTARECGFGDQYDEIRSIIAAKRPGAPEPARLRELKGAIRRAEAKAACRHFGLDDATNVHFLNLPFYETGYVRKSHIGEEDVHIIVDKLREIRPHQVYAAGDLSDPHGTHRVCIEAVLRALRRIREAKDAWLDECRMWLYRGAWQEWELDLVDMAVPLSPDEVIKKRHAIYRHLSQKDIVPFPGEDKREFWQRAEDRTQATARLYDQLGMAEYQAIEVFVRYDFEA